jgi:peroxiredoxin
LVIQVPKYLDQALQEIGHNIREVNEDESVELPIPATYVVEPDGKIIYDFVDVDFTRRADPVEIVTVLRRITV